MVCSKARPFDCEQGMDTIANNVFVSLGSNIICNKILKEVNPQAHLCNASADSRQP